MEKLPNIIHESWHEYLQPLFNDTKMILIRDEVLAKEKFYPNKKEIFKVFSMPIDKIKVVVLGQDPYPKAGQANGLAFAVNRGITEPGSLRIIKKELKQEKDLKFFYTAGIDVPEWRTLEHWFKQGVFLLNTALTVKAGEAGSHLLRWQWFTKEVIRIVSIHSTSKVWLMWGGKAKAYTGLIHKYYKYRGDFKGTEFQYVLEADHPAAETYPGSKGKFTGCNHFNQTDIILKHFNISQIYW